MHSFKLRSCVHALTAIALLGALCPISRAANLLDNGSFQSGDLTDWTTVTTSGNGYPGVDLPAVQSFDVTGGGAQNAAEFNVGEINFTQVYEGAGLSQSVDLPAGTYDVSEDFAVYTPEGNYELGLFSILVDGNTVASDDVGVDFNSNDTVRGSVSDASLNLGAGSHTVEFLVTRPYITDTQTTPFQYISDLSLTSSTATAAPLPSSFWGGLTLLGGLAAWRKARLMIA